VGVLANDAVWALTVFLNCALKKAIYGASMRLKFAADRG
jgi:hypothetical protein